MSTEQSAESATGGVVRRFAAFFVAFIGRAAHAAEKGGAAVAVYGGLTATELAAFGGLIVAILGYITGTIVNIYFKRQHLLIAQKAAKADENE